MLALVKSYNCILLVTVSLLHYIPPKCVKTSEPEDEQLCVTVHTINNIHDADPLDKSSSKMQINLHCLT